MLAEDRVSEEQQISVFLENRPGALGDVAQALAGAGVNLRALAIAETARFGILRLIVDDVDTARSTLHDLGLTTRVTKVLGVEVPDRPGALAEILSAFDGDVSVDYMYAELSGGSGRAVLIMKVDPFDRARELLTQGS